MIAPPRFRAPRTTAIFAISRSFLMYRVPDPPPVRRLVPIRSAIDDQRRPPAHLDLSELAQRFRGGQAKSDEVEWCSGTVGDYGHDRPIESNSCPPSRGGRDASPRTATPPAYSSRLAASCASSGP